MRVRAGRTVESLQFYVWPERGRKVGQFSRQERRPAREEWENGPGRPPRTTTDATTAECRHHLARSAICLQPQPRVADVLAALTAPQLVVRLHHRSSAITGGPSEEHSAGQGGKTHGSEFSCTASATRARLPLHKVTSSKLVCRSRRRIHHTRRGRGPSATARLTTAPWPARRMAPGQAG